MGGGSDPGSLWNPNQGEVKRIIAPPPTVHPAPASTRWQTSATSCRLVWEMALPSNLRLADPADVHAFPDTDTTGRKCLWKNDADVALGDAALILLPPPSHGFFLLPLLLGVLASPFFQPMATPSAASCCAATSRPPLSLPAHLILFAPASTRLPLLAMVSVFRDSGNTSLSCGDGPTTDFLTERANDPFQFTKARQTLNSTN